MWHKKHRQVDPEDPPAKRLRDNLIDLYASGEVPGDRAQSVLNDAGEFACELGSGDLQELRGSIAAGSGKNQERDLRRNLLRRSRWPPIYVAEIRCYSLKQRMLRPQKVAFLLPHELVGVLQEVSDPRVLVQHGALDTYNQERHGHILEQLHSPFLSISLWGDGIPCSWDRKKSLDVWVIGFPGLEEKTYRDLRLVLTALPHEACVRETQDDVLAILGWSFACLAEGCYPSARHDGQAWLPEDVWRRKREGQELLHAAVIEVKADWKQMHYCFAVPYWSRAPEKPLCWRCTACKTTLLTETGPDSSWLQPENRLDQYQVLERALADGGSLSPIFSFPWVSTASLRIDWLHCADQGVTAVFLGGLFHWVLSQRGWGPNEEARCAQLWREIQFFYDMGHIADRLHNLTVTMIKPKKGSIELTGSGAQIRSLVPFALRLVNSWAEPLGPEEFAARSSMRHLARCYEFLRAAMPPQDDSLLDNGLAFHGSLLVLHGIFPKRWQIRPKLHMFLELCAEKGPPSSSWNYRDESFGGSVSHQGHRRGGFGTPLAMSRGVLTKFCAKEALPRLV